MNSKEENNISSQPENKYVLADEFLEKLIQKCEHKGDIMGNESNDLYEAYGKKMIDGFYFLFFK